MPRVTGSGQLLEELKGQVQDLDDNKFKVMLMWEPDTSEDVGWMIVRKDVEVDLSMFQVRDLNLKTLVSDKQILISENVPEEGKVNEKVTPFCSDTVDSFQYERNYLNDANDDNMHDLSANQACTMHTADEQPKAKYNKANYERKIKRKCPECGDQVSHGLFLIHLKTAHNVEPGKLKAKCDECGSYVRKFNLEFHKEVTHGIKGEESKLINGEKSGEVETKLNNSDSQKVDFKIIYQGRHFDCSRSSSSSIKGALKKFCKQVGQDLVFKCEEVVLTGEERTEDFAGGVILASGN